MNRFPRQRRLTAAALTALAVITSATACGSGSGGTGANAADSGTYTVWDPYPQFDKSSAWAKLLDGCGTEAGVKIKRTAFDTSDLSNKALLAAQQDNSADVLIVDNPVVSTLAEAGVLTTTDDNELYTSKVDPNLLAAGQSGGKTYGTPIGANTLALYYNKEVLKKAGVDIASVKDWKSLTAALVRGEGERLEQEMGLQTGHICAVALPGDQDPHGGQHSDRLPQ
ncbi:hypothetical protein GCM10017771_89380 [Streptomyces capitiformicae]|uniref:Extracellular solute-binding protein n=1 Tax=Streptomyces capitiformicae TaxID=2014920 RepID=A0A919DQF7_9ACTN|nr:hypothetical protein GCM10017771_89380 [Streptomyces capitiformicae]